MFLGIFFKSSILKKKGDDILKLRNTSVNMCLIISSANIGKRILVFSPFFLHRKLNLWEWWKCILYKIHWYMFQGTAVPQTLDRGKSNFINSYLEQQFNF